MITHIWTCEDHPDHYQKLEVDEAWSPEIIESAEKHVRELLEGDHIHIFNEPRSSEDGTKVLHECPGMAILYFIGDHIVLGEE